MAIDKQTDPVIDGKAHILELWESGAYTLEALLAETERQLLFAEGMEQQVKNIAAQEKEKQQHGK